jgi:hypothetical protein
MLALDQVVWWGIRPFLDLYKTLFFCKTLSLGEAIWQALLIIKHTYIVYQNSKNTRGFIIPK